MITFKIIKFSKRHYFHKELFYKNIKTLKVLIVTRLTSKIHNLI